MRDEKLRKIKPPFAIEDELFDDEKLYWVGRPDPLRMIRKDEWALLPTGVFIAVFALFFMSMATSMFDGDFPPSIVRLPFLFVPLAMIGIGLWQAITPLRVYWRGQQTWYAVTDRRLLIVVDGTTRQVESFYDENIDFVRRHSRSDGTGDLLFTKKTITSSGKNRTSITVDVGFHGITDVRYVEDMILQVFFERESKNKRIQNILDQDLPDGFDDDNRLQGTNSA